MKNCSVDIICRTKNRNALLSRAIDSILSQKHEFWHLYVVNDGGDPSGVDRCVASQPGLKDRCTVIHHTTSLGHSRAFMEGFTEGTARYVAWHDDDDCWSPAFLQETVAYLQQPPIPEPCAVVTWVDEIREVEIKGRFQEQSRRLWWAQPYSSVPLWRLLRSNIVPPIGCLFRRDAIAAVGGLDLDLQLYEDWDLLIRLAMQSEIGVIPRVLAEYHIRPSSTGDNANTVSNTTRMDHWGAFVRNKYFREDLCKHSFGVGTLMQVLDALAEERNQIVERSSLLRNIRGLSGLIARKLFRN